MRSRLQAAERSENGNHSGGFRVELHRNKPAEVVQYQSGTPARWGVLGMLNWKEPPGQSQDMLERYLVAMKTTGWTSLIRLNPNDTVKAVQTNIWPASVTNKLWMPFKSSTVEANCNNVTLNADIKRFYWEDGIIKSVQNNRSRNYLLNYGT